MSDFCFTVTLRVSGRLVFTVPQLCKVCRFIKPTSMLRYQTINTEGGLTTISAAKDNRTLLLDNLNRTLISSLGVLI